MMLDKIKSGQRISLVDVVEEIGKNKELERRIEREYSVYCKTVEKSKSVRGWLIDQIKIENRQRNKVEEISPKQFVSLVDMFKVIERCGDQKDIRYVYPIVERMKSGKAPSGAQMSIVSQIWIKCKEREEKGEKSLLEMI